METPTERGRKLYHFIHQSLTELWSFKFPKSTPCPRQRGHAMMQNSSIAFKNELMQKTMTIVRNAALDTSADLRSGRIT